MPEMDEQVLFPGFARHGCFIAMPLSFPDVSLPVPHDESRITALAFHDPLRCFIGGTSGEAARLFFAHPYPPHGYVIDAGPVPGATETVCVLPDFAYRERSCAWGFANGPDGGVVVRSDRIGPSEGIQEWGFRNSGFEEFLRLPDERILDGAFDHDAGRILCATTERLLSVDVADADRRRDIPGPRLSTALPRLARLPGGALLFVDDGHRLVRVDLGRQRTETLADAPEIAPGAWGWITTETSALFADHAGRFHAVDIETGEIRPLGRTALAPVRTAAATLDGRIYGLCGEGIGRFFLLEPDGDDAEDLGPVAAVHGARRYAYDFVSAATGMNGDICFGENDRNAHLWLYMPPILPPRD